MTDSVATENVAIIPLSPLDAIMGSMGFTIIFVFPPSPTAPYDLDRVHSAFISTIEEDYPLFVGKLHVDQVTGVVGILPSKNGAKSIPFHQDRECPLTTDEAIAQVPRSLVPVRDPVNDLITIKATTLHDGGLVLGINANHSLLDGEGMFTFAKVWGMHYRNVPKCERPVINHDRHLVAPRGTGFKLPHPEFVQPKVEVETSGITEGGPKAPMQFPPTSQKPFHLTPQQLQKLKAIVTSQLNDGEYVSTIDVVTSLFLILISIARGHGNDVTITTGVNGRSRFDPPLPPNYAGNVIFNSYSTYKHDEIAALTSESLCVVARRIRESILMRNEEFMRDAIEFIAQDGGRWVDMAPGTKFFFGNDLMFTSWANMGMYDADFGGGKPWYTGPPMIPVCDGLIVIMEGIHETTGLDVLPLLDSKVMDKLTELIESCELLQL